MMPHHDSEKKSMNSQTKPEGETALLLQLLKCSHFIERETNNILTHFGLKQQQFAVLDEVIRNGPISQKELCDNLLFEKSNISRIIKLLSKKKLVQVTNLPIDRRLTLLIETPEGFNQWNACLQELNRVSGDYIPTLSKEEMKQTIRQLKLLEKTFNVKRRNSVQRQHV